MQCLTTSYMSVKFCLYWTRFSRVNKKKRDWYLCSLGVFLAKFPNVLSLIVWKFEKGFFLPETVQIEKFWECLGKLEPRNNFSNNQWHNIFAQGVKFQNFENSHKWFILNSNLREWRVKPASGLPASDLTKCFDQWT